MSDPIVPLRLGPEIPAVRGPEAVQGVLRALLTAYYGSRHLAPDIGRFRAPLDDEQRQRILAGTERVERTLGGNAAGLGLLALFPRAAQSLAARIEALPASRERWLAFERAVARFGDVTAGVTRALRVRKQDGQFVELAGHGHAARATLGVADLIAGERSRRQNRQLMVLEMLAGEPRPRSNPIRILVDVTNKCNFRCRTCYQSHSQDFVFYDLRARVFERLEPYLRTASAINFAGTGEPLLSPDTPDALRFAASHAPGRIELVTNGSLFHRLAGLENDVSRIFLSMDGASPATLGSIRKGADFDKVIGAVRALPEVLRGRICLNMVVCRANVHEIADMARLARSLGVTGLHLQSFHEYLPWHAGLVLEREDQPLLARQIEEAERELSGSQVRLAVMLPVDRDTPAAGDVRAPDHRALLSSLDVVPEAKGRELSSWEAGSREFEESTRFELPAELLAALAAEADNVVEPAEDDARDDEAGRERRIAHLLRVVRDKDDLRLPHCIAPYALLYLQGDGTTRPCCIIDSRAGDMSTEKPSDAWNSPAYVALRRSLLTGRDLPAACHGCQDGSRFAALPELLEEARALGVDLNRLEWADEAGVPRTVLDTVAEAKLRARAPGGELRGYLDRVIDHVVIGWAFHPALPRRGEWVDLYLDGTWIRQVCADQFRDDLFRAGIGDGHHCFAFQLEPAFVDGREHEIAARFADTGVHLNGSPMKVTLE